MADSTSGRFIGICRSLYPYEAQTSEELSVEEGDILYVIDKGNDSWWTVKRKDEDDDDGPEGLVPENYTEQV